MLNIIRTTYQIVSLLHKNRALLLFHACFTAKTKRKPLGSGIVQAFLQDCRKGKTLLKHRSQDGQMCDW